MPDLLAVLSNTMTSETYRLKIDEASISYRRSPIQAPLPFADPLIIDLGQYAPSISISGIVDEVASSDGGVTVPNKETLENAVSDWQDDITITINGDAYIGRISDCVFSVSGAREDRWNFRMSFVTMKRS